MQVNANEKELPSTRRFIWRVKTEPSLKLFAILDFALDHLLRSGSIEPSASENEFEVKTMHGKNAPRW